MVTRDAASPIRVLVVDDSAFLRYNLRKWLAQDPAIQVIGEARDGFHALEQAVALKPDVVTLDVEMPRLNGLDTLAPLASVSPARVIMLSSRTQAGAAVTLTALERGAFDFVAKPGAPDGPGIQEVVRELAVKIKAAALASTAAAHVILRERQTAAQVILKERQRPKDLCYTPSPRSAAEIRREACPERSPWAQDDRTARCSSTPMRRTTGVPHVVLGCSTGGPRALSEVVPGLPGDFPAPIVIVQHMPAGFTRALAQRLDGVAHIAVKEAEDGDLPRPGLALIAPGGRHLRISSAGRVTLGDDPPLHGVRPAVDYAMESAAARFGAATIGVVLTGMGVDGRAGARAIKEVGGRVIAEDESTCVVFGMPRATIEAGAADVITPLGRVVHELGRLVGC